MRVLITGMSSQQGGKFPKVQYVTVSSMIAQALRDAGHEVDHRLPLWDEDLSKYDVLVLGMTPPFSIASRMIYPALHLFKQAVQGGFPIVCFIDDPNYFQYKNQYRSIDRGIQRIFRLGMYDHRPYFQQANEIRDEYNEIVNWLGYKTWPAVVWPVYDWGDRSKLPEIDTIKRFYSDPSPYVPDYPINVSEQRERSWVIGGIVDVREWVEKQQASWPIELYGNAKYNLKPLLEADLVQRFAETTGVLCQPRRHTNGTGWWRSRFLYAAKARSVLVADPADVACLGEPYSYGVGDVESMSTSDVAALAERQAELMLGLVWSKDRYAKLWDEAIEFACDERNKLTW